MDSLVNISHKFIYIKDMSKEIDIENLEKEISKLKFKKNVGNLISEEMYFLDKENLSSTKEKIITECKNYLDGTLKIATFYEDLKITTSWVNITEPGQYHHEHKHPFSIVSGIIFLDNNPANLNLCVESYVPPIPHYLTLNKIFVNLKGILTDMKIHPESQNNLKNHLILFLSDWAHHVEPTTNTTFNRRSLSFNTYWSGFTGVQDEPLASINYKI